MIDLGNATSNAEAADKNPLLSLNHSVPDIVSPNESAQRALSPLRADSINGKIRARGRVLGKFFTCLRTVSRDYWPTQFISFLQNDITQTLWLRKWPFG